MPRLSLLGGLLVIGALTVLSAEGIEQGTVHDLLRDVAQASDADWTAVTLGEPFAKVIGSDPREIAVAGAIRIAASSERLVDRYREVESTLSQTLQLAERAAVELKAEAQVEADRILALARAELAAAEQVAAAVAATPTPRPDGTTSTLPDPAFIELLGETRAIRSLLQALLVSGADAEPFAPRAARTDESKPGW